MSIENADGHISMDKKGRLIGLGVVVVMVRKYLTVGIKITLLA